MPELRVFGFAVGLAVTLILSRWTGAVMATVKLREDREPPVADNEKEQWGLWLKVISQQHVDQSGKIFGWLETMLFFAALWRGSEVIVGGWLAFKVAAKWETWSNVIGPSRIDAPFKGDDLRNVWGPPQPGRTRMVPQLVHQVLNSVVSGT